MPRLVCAAIALLALVGCATPPPTLALTEPKLTERGGDAALLSFTVQAENPGPKPLPLGEVVYALSLGGERVFSAERAAQATLQRFGAQTITLPAVVRSLPERPIPTAPTPYVLEGTITYVTPGALARVLFDAELRQPTQHFHQEGTIDFSAPPTPATPTPLVIPGR